MAIAFKGYQGAGRTGTTSNWTVVNAGQATMLGPDGTFNGASVATGDVAVVVVGVGSTVDRTLNATTSDWTKFGTELYSDGSSADANAAIFYRVATTTSLPALIISGGTGSTADAGQALMFLFSGVDGTTPLDVAIQTATGTATTRPDPPSITPATAGALVLGCGVGATATGALFTDPGSYASGTGYFRSFGTTDTVDCAVFMGIQNDNWASGAVDPAQVSGGTNNAGDSWAAFSIALRPGSGTTLNASFTDNSNGVLGNIFYAASVTTGLAGLSPDLHTNNQTFYDPSIVQSQTVSAPLVTNNAEHYAPTVSATYSVAPSLLTNDQTFYAETVAATYAIEPGLSSNSTTFYGPTFSIDVTPGLLLNTQTFYALEASYLQSLDVGLLESTEAHYGPSVSATYSLAPALSSNSQTFYGPVLNTIVSIGAVFFTNDQAFYAADLDLGAGWSSPSSGSWGAGHSGSWGSVNKNSWGNHSNDPDWTNGSTGSWS